MSNRSFFLSRPRRIIIGAFTAIALIAVACNSSPGTDEPAVTQSTENAPGSTATATASPSGASPTLAPPGPADGPSGRLRIRVPGLPEVRAIRYFATPGNDAAQAASLGSIHEFLFEFKDDDPMGSMLATGWEIDDAGLSATISIREGIPWIAPVGFEHLELGNLTADDFVEMIKREHPGFNPESTSFQGGDLQAVIQDIQVTDELTFRVDLTAPIFYCLPFSKFGCLGTGAAVERVKGVDEMGKEWATQHHVGTGPFRQGECVADDRCSVFAVPDHWRKTPDIAESKLIFVPDANVAIANLKTNAVDINIQSSADLVVDLVQDGLRWIEVPGQFVGQSLLMSGNLWEEFHARTGEELNPWNSDAYSEDFAWIGDPWQETHPDKVRYTDNNNPPGMTDMEQARLVRLGLSMGINRALMNEVILAGIGTELYSEYMGPFYPGWDQSRDTGVWNSDGERIVANGTQQTVPWKIEFDPDEANRLLDLAGFPRDGSGNRKGIGTITMDNGVGEMGPVNDAIGDAIASDWGRLGVNVEIFARNYGSVIVPEMRQRNHRSMILKNGDVHSNVLPLDHPLPPVDSSITRPGWGVGFESKPGARWFFEIVSQRDPVARAETHLEWVDYSLYWLQYIGVYQFPKGIIVGQNVESWDSPVTMMFSNEPVGLEYLVLAD